LNVIVDDVVIDDEVLDDWLDVLGELTPTWVGIRCSPEITAERERRRGDRPLGMTGTQTDSVQRSLRYAFEIDAGTSHPASPWTSSASDSLRSGDPADRGESLDLSFADSGRGRLAMMPASVEGTES
jgi:hypothetical protein